MNNFLNFIAWIAFLSIAVIIGLLSIIIRVFFKLGFSKNRKIRRIKREEEDKSKELISSQPNFSWNDLEEPKKTRLETQKKKQKKKRKARKKLVKKSKRSNRKRK